jgi:hypothetical protein
MCCHKRVLWPTRHQRREQYVAGYFYDYNQHQHKRKHEYKDDGHHVYETLNDRSGWTYTD